MEYLPEGYSTSPSTTKYPLLLYFPGCGEIHNGNIYKHDDGSLNFNYGIGRLFASGEPPIRDFLIDVGSNTTTIVSPGEKWWANNIPEYADNLIMETGFNGTTYSNPGASITNGNGREFLYRNGRQGSELRYQLPIVAQDPGAGRFPNPPRTYTVRLHFAELDLTAAGNRFNIFIEGQLVQSNFDIFASGGSSNAVVLTFPNRSITSYLDIDLVGVDGGVAKIAAIDVIQQNKPASSPTFPALPRYILDNGSYFSAVPEKSRGVLYNASTGPREGFIVFCMQLGGQPTICGENNPSLSPNDINDLLDMVQRQGYKVDLDRIYITGMSAGGRISWLYPGESLSNAQKIAAVAPVCAVEALNGPNSFKVPSFFNGGTNSLTIVNNKDRCNLGVFNLAAGTCTGGGIPVLNINQETNQNLRNFGTNSNRFEEFYFGNPPSSNTDLDHNAWQVGYAVNTNVYNDGVQNYNMYEWLLLNSRAFLLPVNLVSFNARKVGSSVHLNWTTATEVNSSFFTLERSLDGRNFSQVARIDAAGNSTVERTYSHVDGDIPATRYVYYRLLQTDKDGKVQQFGVRKVFVGNQGFEIKAYPTITSGQLTLEVQGITNERIDIRVVDVSGKVLMRQFMAPRQNRLDLQVGRLAKGVYLIQASSESYQHVTKFVKQ
jgi:hypothetical protein